MNSKIAIILTSKMSAAEESQTTQETISLVVH